MALHLDAIDSMDYYMYMKETTNTVMANKSSKNGSPIHMLINMQIVEVLQSPPMEIVSGSEMSDTKRVSSLCNQLAHA